jgi:hypothetical protein
MFKSQPIPLPGIPQSLIANMGIVSLLSDDPSFSFSCYKTVSLNILSTNLFVLLFVLLLNITSVIPDENSVRSPVICTGFYTINSPSFLLYSFPVLDVID